MEQTKMVKVEDLVEGDRVDLETCPFLKELPTAQMEWAIVTNVTQETPMCVAVDYEGIDRVGYLKGTTLRVRIDGEPR